MRSLVDELTLVAFDHERGKVAATTGLPYALGGAVVLELLLRDLVEDRHGTIVVGGVAAPTGEVALDEGLERIRESRKERDTKHWVQQLGSRGKLVERSLDNLFNSGVLRRERRRILGLFPVTRYAVTDPASAREPVDRVRAAVLDQVETEPRTAILAGLTHGAGLVDRLVERSQRKAARARAEQFAEEGPVRGAVSDVVKETQAAVTAAITAATVAASSSSSASSS